jgi:hypothetical protein
MGDRYLHGLTRGDHNFTVASMASRRAGRTFWDLACGTGMHRIHHTARIHHNHCPAASTSNARTVPAHAYQPLGLSNISGTRVRGSRYTQLSYGL